MLHYEGGGSRTSSTDIVCPMYMRVWDMVKIAKDPTEARPLILCEYVIFVFHYIGNSAWQTLTGNSLFFVNARSSLAGILIQWETAVVIFTNIGKQLIIHLVFKEASFGIGLIRFEYWRSIVYIFPIAP